ncbi:MAG TPA: DNA recombination protein RmuC [Terriglobales bacterium]
MNIAVVIVLVLAGLVIGAAFAWLAGRSKSAVLAERKSELERDLAAVKSQLAQQQADNSALSAAKAAFEATLESERRSTGEKLRLLSDASEEMKAQFKALAAAALESSNASFLQLAKGTLEKYQSEARGELEKREKAVETLVKPISDSLKQVDEHVRELEKSRAEAYGNLTSQVALLLKTQEALQTETGNLVKAMREPQARGRWGELQLRRCLELAGMLEYCDFLEQVSVTIDERTRRPDVVVKLPGEKNIVIDSKVPLTAYLAALEAQDEATRKDLLTGHARQVRQHIENLSSKSYWTQFESTPEFVVLFLPGEVFFRAAMDADAELIEYGVKRKVIGASPTTLIALLRAVAYGWNQKNLAESAREISTAGKTLYERLTKMAWHFEEIGKRLGGAVDSYNKAVGSMERSVFPIARKLPELDRSLSAADLPDLHQVEKTPRQLESPDWQLQPDPEPLSLVGEDADPGKS